MQLRWQLRPEYKFGGQSQLIKMLDHPDKFLQCLENCSEDYDEEAEHAPSILELVLALLDSPAAKQVMKDPNIPVPTDFSQDLDLRSPLTIALEAPQVTKSLVDRIILYLSSCEDS